MQLDKGRCTSACTELNLNCTAHTGNISLPMHSWLQDQIQRHYYEQAVHILEYSPLANSWTN